MPFYPPNRSLFVWEVEQRIDQGYIPLPITRSGKRDALLDERNEIVKTITGRYIAVPSEYKTTTGP